MVQPELYNHWKRLFLLFLILCLVVVSCQATKRSGVLDTAIRQQDAAEYYYKQKEYIRAEKYCKEALASWKQIKDKIIKKVPDSKINRSITRCEYILSKCSEYDRGRLFVNTNPSDAMVSVLELGPRFLQQGMRLEPGMYTLMISAPGYKTKIILTKLSFRENKRITVDLQTGKVSEVEAKPSGIDKERKHLGEKPKKSRDAPELANIPKNMSSMRVYLRTEPIKLMERDIRRMLSRYDFYDDNFNWRGSFVNDFVDNGDGTITDRATGLMWQKSGCSRAKSWKRAQTYIKQLNEDQFAGYSDWRLPTIEELASLVEREKVHEVHIDPVFYNKQEICWSADKGPVFGGATWNPPQVWHVNFREGSLGLTVLPTFYKGATSALTRHYIRAVRSLR